MSFFKNIIEAYKRVKFCVISVFMFLCRHLVLILVLVFIYTGLTDIADGHVLREDFVKTCNSTKENYGPECLVLKVYMLYNTHTEDELLFFLDYNIYAFLDMSENDLAKISHKLYKEFSNAFDNKTLAKQTCISSARLIFIAKAKLVSEHYSSFKAELFRDTINRWGEDACLLGKSRFTPEDMLDF